MVLMRLRHGTPEEVRRFGGEPAVILYRMLEDTDRRTTWFRRTISTAWSQQRQGAFLNRCRQMTQDQVPPPLQQPEFLKWRHWRPSRVREIEPTTQRALEGKWAERLLAHLVPFAEHIPHLKDILGEDFRKEALDLLGSGRCGSIAWHTRTSGRRASR